MPSRWPISLWLRLLCPRLLTAVRWCMCDVACVCVSQAASHELKGLRAYFTAKQDDPTLPRLCVPIMSIIDYCGWRMIACCRLPIGKNTLSYGSAG